MNKNNIFEIFIIEEIIKNIFQILNDLKPEIKIEDIWFWNLWKIDKNKKEWIEKIINICNQIINQQLEQNKEKNFYNWFLLWQLFIYTKLLNAFVKFDEITEDFKID